MSWQFLIHMSKFNLSWTLQLQTSIEKFNMAFYDVVTKENKFVLQIASSASNINKDFFGTIDKDTFTIWKRQGIFDPNTFFFTLDGKITSNANSLTLNLGISNKFAINFAIKRFVVNIIITAVFFLFLTRVLWATHLLSGKMTSIYLIISIPTLFVLGYFLQTKIFEMYLAWLKGLYNEVLRQIERQSNLN
jgi:hypothetical protein